MTVMSSTHAICTGNMLIAEGTLAGVDWQYKKADMAICYRHMISKQCQHKTIACRGINRQCQKRGTQVAVKKDYKLGKKTQKWLSIFPRPGLEPGSLG